MPLAWFDKYIQRYAKEQSVLAFQNGSPGRSCHSPFRRVPRTRRDTQASGGGMCVLHGTPGTFWVDLTGARYDYCRGDPGDAYYNVCSGSPPLQACLRTEDRNTAEKSLLLSIRTDKVYNLTLLRIPLMITLTADRGVLVMRAGEWK